MEDCVRLGEQMWHRCDQPILRLLLSARFRISAVATSIRFGIVVGRNRCLHHRSGALLRGDFGTSDECMWAFVFVRLQFLTCFVCFVLV